MSVYVFCLTTHFQFPWVYAQEWNCWVTGQLHLQLIGEPQCFWRAEVGVRHDRAMERGWHSPVQCWPLRELLLPNQLLAWGPRAQTPLTWGLTFPGCIFPSVPCPTPPLGHCHGYAPKGTEGRCLDKNITSQLAVKWF